MKTMLRWFGVAALVLAMACGDEGNSGGNVDVDDDPNPSMTPEPDPQPDGGTCDLLEAPTEPAAVVLLYADNDETDLSTYVGSYEGGRDDLLGNTAVSLMSENGELEIKTCADGRAGFGPLEAGSYLIAPSLPDGHCTRKNCPRRLPDAIREGNVKIVTFGDSVPVQGDSPFFPSRLTDLMAPLATIDNQNIAIGGTTSRDWLPGTNAFENRLTPQLADADVVIISLGGNDILAFVQANIANLGNIDQLVQDVRGVIEQIVSNILQTVTAIRAINPNVDIVYALYPDYSLATSNQLWGTVNNFVGAGVVHDVLELARDTLPLEEDIILVDVFAASEGLALDDYLFDPLHFNHFGQTLYAEEIFKALGGVLVGPSPLIQGAPRTPLGLRQEFAISTGSGQ